MDQYEFGIHGDPAVRGHDAIDADHVRAEIGQQRGTERPGADTAEFDDPDSGEWSHVDFPCCSPAARSCEAIISSPAARLRLVQSQRHRRRESGGTDARDEDVGFHRFPANTAPSIEGRRHLAMDAQQFRDGVGGPAAEAALRRDPEALRVAFGRGESRQVTSDAVGMMD